MTEAVIVAVIGSGALSAVISGIFSFMQSGRKKSEGIIASSRILLYDRIKYLGRKHIADGFIEAEDLEDLIEMHRIYHDELAGNGYLDSVMNAVRNLPIR